MPTARRHGAARLHHPPARAIVSPQFSARAWVLGFGCLLLFSPIFIGKDAPSSNKTSTDLFQDWIFKLEFRNVLIFQVAAKPRDSPRECQLSD
jgi:hypothetical protein